VEEIGRRQSLPEKRNFDMESQSIRCVHEIKTDDDYLRRAFDVCGLYQHKRELLRTLKPQRSPEREAEIQSLNQRIIRAEKEFRADVADTLSSRNPFAFERMCDDFELDEFERKVLLYFVYLEITHVSENICQEIELLEIFDTEDSTLFKVKHFGCFAVNRRLRRNELLFSREHSTPGSETVAFVLSSKVLEIVGGFISDGESVSGIESDAYAKSGKTPVGCSEVGSVKEPRFRLSEVILKENVWTKVMFFLSAFKEPAMSAFEDTQAMKKGTGLHFLFYGPPGTGKSMLAEAIAAELGKNILLVETPKITSRWYGETDKQITRLFKTAKENDLVLCMDEADSLLYNRSFAGQEHDIRFVNIMLQEIERFEGVSVFTTNMDVLLDPALERRISLRVKFEPPDERLRADIWRSHIPQAVQVEADVDFSVLARQFEFSGGYIRNAVLNALRRIAMERRQNIQMNDLVWAGNLEKEGLFHKGFQHRINGFAQQ
jgi:AAA+ superfamily predicted ATPase